MNELFEANRRVDKAMDNMFARILEKLIFGAIIFFFIYFIFGTMGLAIIYVSGDVLHIVENHSSILCYLFTANELTEDIAIDFFGYYYSFVFESVPFHTFLDGSFGTFYDGAEGSILAFIIEIISNIGNPEIAKNFVYSFETQTTEIVRGVAVAALASFVIFAVIDLKDNLNRVVTKFFGVEGSLAAALGFGLASVFWIFAGYTFGESLTRSLAIIMPGSDIVLYIVIAVFALCFETVIRAYAKRCTVMKVAATLLVKLLFNATKAFLAWFMCRNILLAINNFAGIDPDNVLPFLQVSLKIFMSITIIAVLFFFLSVAEQKLEAWCKKKKSLLPVVQPNKLPMPLK